MGQERTGQLYSLDMESHLNEEAIRLRQVSLARVCLAETKMQEGASGGEHSAVVAEHAYHSQRLKRLTEYCVAKGIDEDTTYEVVAIG